MKRVLIALLTALPLTIGVAGAQAATHRFPGFPGWGGGGSTSTQQAAVAGTVVSVNAGAGTFVADAYVLSLPGLGTGGSGGSGGFGGSGGSGGSGGFGGFGGFGGSGGFGAGHVKHSVVTPTTTQVTITTNSSTTIHVGGMSGAGTGTVSDLVPGAKFLALFPGAPTDTIQALVANPATMVFARVPKQLYAFVGTVTVKDAAAGTLAVNVMTSIPSGLAAGGSSATFTVGPHTWIIGGSSLTGGSGGGLFGGLFGGSLSDVSTGDIVAGGLIGNAGLTATQVAATPLMFLLDLPAPAGASNPGAATKALKLTLKVMHGGKIKLKHGKKSHGKKPGKKAGSKNHSARH